MRAVRGFIVISAAQLILSPQRHSVWGPCSGRTTGRPLQRGSQVASLIAGRHAVIFVVLRSYRAPRQGGDPSCSTSSSARTGMRCRERSVFLLLFTAVTFRCRHMSRVRRCVSILVVLSGVTLVGSMFGALSDTS